jgi:hypothetical protein
MEWKRPVQETEGRRADRKLQRRQRAIEGTVGRSGDKKAAYLAEGSRWDIGP